MHHFRKQLIKAFMFQKNLCWYIVFIKVKCEFIWSHIVIIHMVVPYYKKDFNDLWIVICYQCSGIFWANFWDPSVPSPAGYMLIYLRFFDLYIWGIFLSFLQMVNKFLKIWDFN